MAQWERTWQPVTSDSRTSGLPTYPRKDDPEALQKRFDELKREWSDDVAGYSTIRHMVAHPAYLAILALGPDVLPLVLREFCENGGHWLHALRALTGKSPVPYEEWGDMTASRSRWREWGESHGLI